MFAQINLFRWNFPLNTGNLDVSKLPLELQRDFEDRRDPITGNVTISLMQNFLLLEQLSLIHIYLRYLNDEITAFHQAVKGKGGEHGQ